VVSENERDGDGSDGSARGHSPEQRSGNRPPLWSLLASQRIALPQQPVDATEQEQLALTVRARSDVREQGGVVAVFEQVWQPSPRLFMVHRDSSPGRLASRFRPRRFQLLTDPSGTRSLLAIALSLRSS
jgi:hypothetical protein